jgi:hypothetical protein
MFYRLIYTSKASDKFVAADISHIVKSAQAHNKRIGVTGLLMFIEDGFIQYLEGNEEDVLNVYHNIIVKDKRHKNLKIILQGNSLKRDFDSWNMGLKIITNEDLDEVRSLNNNPDFDLFAELNGQPDIAKEVLKYYYLHGDIDFSKFWGSDNRLKL